MNNELELPQQMGLGQGAHQNIHDNWDTYNSVMGQLAREGFQPIPAPSFPCPPYVSAEQLTDQDTTRYTNLYAQVNAWQNYSEYCLACIDFAVIQTENEMDVITLKTKERLREESKAEPKAKKPSEDYMKEVAKCDPRYMQLRLYLQMLQQKRLVVKSQMDRLSRNLKMLSRQVTIRGQEIEQGRRGHNLGRQFG